jgi:hypothetical protein
MISTDEAEKALDFLRHTAMQMEKKTRDAKAAARKAKYEMALAIVRMENANTSTKVPATVRKEHAIAEDNVQAALKDEDEKAAELIGINAQRDAARDTIILHMSMVKDRM